MKKPASPPRRRARTIAADGRPSPGRRAARGSGRDPLRAGARAKPLEKPVKGSGARRVRKNALTR